MILKFIIANLHNCTSCAFLPILTKRIHWETLLISCYTKYTVSSIYETKNDTEMLDYFVILTLMLTTTQWRLLSDQYFLF